MKESSDGAETATAETGTAHGCICGVEAKEAVYRISMARMDPPLDATSFFPMQNRAWTGAANLFLPALFSPLSLPRLANPRIAG